MNIKTAINKYNEISKPVKAALWYTICNFINKGIALLSTPIFTRILTEEQYGTFSIFQSWFNILIIFTSLNIFLSGYTKGLLLYKEDKDGFTSSQLSLTSCITLIFFIVYIINIDFWTKIFELSPILIFAMFVELLVMPALEFWTARERFDYNYKKVIIISISMNVLCLALSVLAILMTNYKIEARILPDVFVKLLFAGTLFIFILIKGKKLYNKEYWKYALKFNLPLIPHYLSNYILNQSDRLMIGKMVGKVQAAYYSVSNTISNVMMLLVLAINNSLTPYIYKTINDKHPEKIKNKISPIVILIALLSIVIMAFAPEVISIFAGKEYMDAIYVIPPITASVYFIFIYSMFSTIEYYYEKTGLIAIATSISAILNIILNYFGIKLFGYYAAGYTTLICYVCLSICHYIFYKKIIKEKLPELKDVYDTKLMAITSLLILGMMIFMSIIYKFILMRYVIILFILLFVFIKRKYIIDIIKSLKK